MHREMQVRKDVKERKCEGGKMRRRGEKEREKRTFNSFLLFFLFSPPSQFRSFAFLYACTVPPPQCY